MTTIVCGTDFSCAAADATTVAARLALRLGASLQLVHVDDSGGEDHRDEMKHAAARIGEQPVEFVMRSGSPAESLVDAAAHADLLVIGGTGHRYGTHWLIGSTAEQIAQHGSVPVLIVRDAAGLCEAIEGNRRAKAVVATDLCPDSEPVIRWATEWRATIPSEVHLAYVANPAMEYARLGIEGPIHRHTAHPIMQAELTRRLREAAVPFGEAGVEAGFTLTLGATSKELVRIADESHADLLIVGAYQRARVTRLWQESVAHGVLHASRRNVVVVPLTAERAPD